MSSEDGKKDDKESDSGEKNQVSRIINLTDDEMKTFQGTHPGEDLACEVHGTLEDDGHFHVMSVQPLGGAKDYGEQGMAGQIAQRVTPTIQPAPSA